MKNPLPTIIGIIALFAVFSGNFGFFIPLLIIYFVVRSMSSQKRNEGPRQYPPRRRRDYDPYQRPRRRETDFDRQREYRRPAPQPKSRPKPKPRSKPNPYKKSGVDKYKEFDYEGAIEDFKKALEINPRDIPTLFNIACAYSLTEQKEQAFIHISKAVEYGFKDLDKIRTHDAFAYIRVQDEFEQFEKNGFRWTKRPSDETKSENNETAVDPDLLEKLKRLAELRDRGILTEEEFTLQKEKLLR